MFILMPTYVWSEEPKELSSPLGCTVGANACIGPWWVWAYEVLDHGEPDGVRGRIWGARLDRTDIEPQSLQ